jgi:hypothetical protein
MQTNKNTTVRLDEDSQKIINELKIIALKNNIQLSNNSCIELSIKITKQIMLAKPEMFTQITNLNIPVVK